ncbi:ladderlectin-like [Pholidichthys leucotaenia]
MKLLIISGLLCAVVALITAAALREEVSMDEKGHGIVKMPFPSCPCGWTEFKGRCYLYVPRRMKWQDAQSYCASMNANLASVHCTEEYNWVQKVIRDATNKNEVCWIGATDATKEGAWGWSDGTKFIFNKWCKGNPNNYQNREHCLLMNYPQSGDTCWNDVTCEAYYPSVCTKTIF